MSDRFDQIRFLILGSLISVLSFEAVATEKNMKVFVPRLQCTNELNRNLPLQWWAIFPPYFFSQAMTADVDEIKFNLESFEEEVASGNAPLYLFYLRYMFYSVENLKTFIAISMGKIDLESSLTFALERARLDHKIQEVFRSYPKQIFDPLYNFGEKEKDIGDLMGFAIFFQTNPKFLEHFLGKIPADFLDRVLSRILMQISVLIQDGKKRIDHLPNDTFAKGGDGTFHTVHPISTAMATLEARAATMKSIFRFSLLNLSRLKKEDIDKLVEMAKQLVQYRPLVLGLAQEAIDNKLVTQDFIIDIDRILDGDSMAFRDLKSAYRLLRDLDTAEKFLVEAVKKRD